MGRPAQFEQTRARIVGCSQLLSSIDITLQYALSQATLTSG